MKQLSDNITGVHRRNQVLGIWRRLPNVNCKGLCQESCGPISMTHTEAQIIRRGMKDREVPVFNREKGQCSFLTEDGKCRGYEVRPMVCRLFGSVPDMACPHGCEPVLTDKQGNLYMASVFRISKGKPHYHSDPELIEAMLQLVKEGGPSDVIQGIADNANVIEGHGEVSTGTADGDPDPSGQAGPGHVPEGA